MATKNKYKPGKPPSVKSDVVDREKLKGFRRVLRALRERGYAVEENLACCNRCGLVEADRIAADIDADGAIFYHAQDLEVIEETGLAYLSFVGYTMYPTEAAADIAFACWAEGLEVTWNGRPDARPMIDLRKE